MIEPSSTSARELRFPVGGRAFEWRALEESKSFEHLLDSRSRKPHDPEEISAASLPSDRTASSSVVAERSARQGLAATDGKLSRAEPGVPDAEAGAVVGRADESSHLAVGRTGLADISVRLTGGRDEVAAHVATRARNVQLARARYADHFSVAVASSGDDVSVVVGEAGTEPSWWGGVAQALKSWLGHKGLTLSAFKVNGRTIEGEGAAAAALRPKSFEEQSNGS